MPSFARFRRNNRNAQIPLDSQNNDQRRVVERYLFSKLQVYAHKSRLWQLTHSTRIKQRLIDKSTYISTQYSIPMDFVRQCIEEFFNRIEKNYVKFRPLFDRFSSRSSSAKDFFGQSTSSSNQWHQLQLERARETFPNFEEPSLTDDELLQEYQKHIQKEFTPKADRDQGREQPFDLDSAYRQAENTGKKYLNEMLASFRSNASPDLELIEEMIHQGLQRTKTGPSEDDFRKASSLLAKVSLICKGAQAYRSGLENMADDFLLLRFGKVLGSKALPNTASTSDEFVYLVHLFLQSVCFLLMMLKSSSDHREEISMLITAFQSTGIHSSVVTSNDENLFSPQSNVDRWTWLLEKWREALRTFPILLVRVGGFARLVRTSIGIGIVQLYHFAETIIETKQSIDNERLNDELFHALQLGFYFGVAYAIVDCLQDQVRNLDQNVRHYFKAFSNEENSTPTEIVDRWLTVMERILTGEEFDRKQIPKTPLTPLLLETFDSLVSLTKRTNSMTDVFNELALLLRSQRMDKMIPEQFYNDEQLYLGAILKSHFTYTCTTHLGRVKSARDESERLWVMPFLGQITDDCRDFYEDVTSNSVTSFTHYATFVGRRPISEKNLLNPFDVFLHLCSNIYRSSDRDPQTGAFLGRRILRTLKSIEISSAPSALREFLHIFCAKNLPLHQFCFLQLRQYFPQINDPEKSAFRHIQHFAVSYARTNRKLETYVGDHLQQIEDALQIQSISNKSHDEEFLISAMNYSVKAGGKRLRPLLLFMASDLYDLDIKKTLPLARVIEYLHTSSLILDDLPAQDNSDLRRGQPTLHRATIDNDFPRNLCEGRAQLAAVDLIAISMNLINENLSRNGFKAETILEVIGEISRSMHELCVGQMMDLRAARVGIEQGPNQLDELDRIAWLKTGKAIEIGLISPAILALSSSSLSKAEQTIELDRIRELSRLMGILFQMRDDLLDIEGENLGKPTALDVKNNTVTYVSTLGVEGIRLRLKELRQQTLKLVDLCWPQGAATIKDVINYMIDRKN